MKKHPGMFRCSSVILLTFMLITTALSSCNKPDDPTTEGLTTEEKLTTAAGQTTEGEPDIPPVEKKIYTEVIGAVRIQLLSDSVIRVEKSVSDKFCDDTTVAVVNRENWDGVALERVEEDGIIKLKTENYTVAVSPDAETRKDVKVTSPDGSTVYWDGTKHAGDKADTELPYPGDTPSAWSFSDKPRIIMSEAGFSVTDAASFTKNNGWKYSTATQDDYVFVSLGDAFALRRDFVRLTGSCNMVNLQSLGFWFSRFYPYSDKEVLALIDTFREKGYPIDNFVVDTNWKEGGSTGYDVAPQYFPNVKDFFDKAHSRNVRITFNDHVHESTSSLLTYEELSWFSENLSRFLSDGLDNWWYDRNWNYHLKSPFSGLNADMLGQMLYISTAETVRTNSRPDTLSNLYWVNNGSIAGMPHVSAHRYGIQWSGDIRSESTSLKKEIENTVAIGAATGTAYISSDIGGHLGNPAEELFVRWSQYGALSPIMRYHAAGFDRSPWTVGDIADEVSREYIRLRYRLLPLYYTLANENYTDGLPIARRPDFYDSSKAAKDNTEYLLGEDILVAPIYTSAIDSCEMPASWFTDKDGKPGLTVSYYKGENLAGEPVYTGNDPDVHHNWGTGFPASGVGSDSFSAVFEGKVTIPDNLGVNSIRFGAISDDGIRIYIDGEKVVDYWQASFANEIIGASGFETGRTYNIRVEYYEGAGDALIQLRYTPNLPGNPAPVNSSWFKDKEGNTGLSAAYYNNQTMSGTPAWSGTEPSLTFNWGTGAPHEGVNADGFSAVYEGSITIGGEYDGYLGIISDDGMRLYIDGALAIDHWKASDSEKLFAPDLYKKGTTHTVRVEYYEGAGNAVAQLIFKEDIDRSELTVDTRDVYLPAGFRWMNVFTGETFEGGQTVSVTCSLRTSPLFVKVGAVLTLADVGDYADTAQWEHITLDIYAAEGTADTTVLYEDDGKTNAYKNGSYRRTTYTSKTENGILSLTGTPEETSYTGSFTTRTYTVRLHGFTGDKAVTVNGKTAEIARISRLSSAMPFAVEGGSPDGDIIAFTFTCPVGEEFSVTVK